MARILVLLEPFPIRNTHGAHAWIGERLGRMLLAEDQGFTVADMRIACNAPTLADIAGKVPSARPYLVGIPATAEVPFTAAMADWHTAGLAEWRAIQAGSPKHEAIYATLLDSLCATYPFDVLAYWGTNETLRAAAGRLGVPVLWAEYGPLRPPFLRHLCLDAQGVNGLASGRDSLQLREAGALPTIPGAALDLPAGQRSAYEATMTVPSASSTVSFATLMRFAKGKREVILLALQLGDDANILAFGDGWTGRTMVETMLKLRAGPGVGFILRPHPGESGSYHNMVAGEAALAAAAERDDVLVFDAESEEAYLACLSVATEVVSINSSVCFEAALLGKPVRVLGQASYMPPNGGADLTAAPALLDDEAVATLLRDRFIPEDRFWTLACWREAAAALGTAESDTILPHLPTMAAKVLGPTHELGDGQLVVQGIGALRLLSSAQPGFVDDVVGKDTPLAQFTVQGWGIDPRTGGALAGFIITTGEHSVWCAAIKQRLDVARHHRDPKKLTAGFAMTVALADMPSAQVQPITVYGVTVAGSCLRFLNQWRYDPAQSGFTCQDALAEAA